MSGSLGHPLIQYGINPPSVYTLVVGDGVQVVITLKDSLDLDWPLSVLCADYGKVVSVTQTLFWLTQTNAEEVVCGFHPHDGREHRGPGKADPKTFKRIERLWNLQGLHLVLAEVIELEHKLEAEVRRRQGSEEED